MSNFNRICVQTIICLLIVSTGSAAEVNLFERISADSSRGNKQRAEIEYRGNVVIQLSNLRVMAQQTTASKTRFSATGQPLTFRYRGVDSDGAIVSIDISCNQLDYSLTTGEIKFNESIEVNLTKPGSNVRFSAEQMSYRHDVERQNQPIALRANGSPIALTTELNGEQANFSAGQLSLDLSDSLLKLTDNVIFDNNNNRIKGSTLLYHLTTGNWEFPAVIDKRIEITKMKQND